MDFSSSIKFIQISDVHIVPEGSYVYGVDTRSRFRKCLEEIKKDHFDADFIIITGDCTHNGDIESFQYIKESLSNVGIPWYLVAGNHDSRGNLQRVIPEHPKDPNGFIQFTVDTKLGPCIVIDSAQEGQSSGVLCEKRLNWLQATLAKNSSPFFLFLHHPVLPFGISSVDSIRLDPTSTENLLDILTPHKERIQHIFMGHIHRTICGSWNGIPFSTLSSMSLQVVFNNEPSDTIYLVSEPPLYAVVLAKEDQVVVHFKEFDEEREIRTL